MIAWYLQFIFAECYGFLSAYTLSDTESTLKSPAEGEGVPLGVTHQKKQDAEDNPVERPQDKLSMCNVN